jgi:hypothetical protein
VYLGPFGNSQLGSGNTTQFPTVAAGLVTAIQTGAAKLSTQVAEPVKWVIYSPTDDTARQVAAGWIDNEWDTQRRRQSKPVSRSTITVNP